MNDHSHVGGEVIEPVLLAITDGAIMPDRDVAISDCLEDSVFSAAIEERVVLSGEGRFSKILHG